MNSFYPLSDLFTSDFNIIILIYLRQGYRIKTAYFNGRGVKIPRGRATVKGYGYTLPLGNREGVYPVGEILKPQAGRLWYAF